MKDSFFFGRLLCYPIREMNYCYRISQELDYFRSLSRRRVTSFQ